MLIELGSKGCNVRRNITIEVKSTWQTKRGNWALFRMVVLTASTSPQASWWWEGAQKEEVGSPHGGFLPGLSAQGADLPFD